MSRELQELYKSLTKHYNIGVSFHFAERNGTDVDMPIISDPNENMIPDGSCVKIPINDSIYSLYENGVIIPNAIGEANFNAIVRDFLEEAEQRLEMSSVMKDYSKFFNGKFGITTENLGAIRDENADLINSDDFVKMTIDCGDDEIYELFHDLERQYFPTMYKRIGDERKLLNLDEIYPALFKIEKHVSSVMQQELQEFMRAPQLKVKSGQEMYGWFKEKLGAQNVEESARELILLKSQEGNSIQCFITPDGDILNLNKRIKHNVWQQLMSQHENSYKTHGTKSPQYVAFIDDILAVINTANFGKMKVNQKTADILKDFWVNKIIDQCANLQIYPISDIADLIEKRFMFSERLNQLRYDMREHLLIDALQLFHDCEKINAIRESFDLPRIGLHNLIGDDHLDRLNDAVDTASSEVMASNGNQDLTEEQTIILENTIAKHLWFQDKREIEKAFRHLDSIDLTAQDISPRLPDAIEPQASPAAAEAVAVSAAINAGQEI